MYNYNLLLIIKTNYDYQCNVLHVQYTHSIRGAHFLCATLYYEIEAWGKKSEAVDRAGLEERMEELPWIIPIKFIPWTRFTPERRKSSEIVQKKLRNNYLNLFLLLRDAVNKVTL